MLSRGPPRALGSHGFFRSHFTGRAGTHRTNKLTPWQPTVMRSKRPSRPVLARSLSLSVKLRRLDRSGRSTQQSRRQIGGTIYSCGRLEVRPGDTHSGVPRHAHGAQETSGWRLVAPAYLGRIGRQPAFGTRDRQRPIARLRTPFAPLPSRRLTACYREPMGTAARSDGRERSGSC